jgi:NAD(P)-dependent dehydrogenase (short-subunit alcohol dehydrogenase family)
MDLNFMGVMRCTKAVLPHMRTARSGHVVNISSVGGLVGQPFNEIYCAAKFAVEGYTESLACYVTPSFGINFTSVEPGGIRTEFVANVMAQVAGSGGVLDDEYKPILDKYLGAARNRQAASSAYQTADEAAAVVVDVIEAESPPIRVRTSAWAEEFTKLKTLADPDGKKLQAEVIERFLS